MTDQSKPGRQDGDGPSLEAIDWNTARLAEEERMERDFVRPTRDAAEGADTYDLLMRLRDYLDINRRPGNDLSPKFSAEISAALVKIDSAPPKPAHAMREALFREERYLVEHFGADCDIMSSDIEGSFHRLRECLPVSNEAKLREQAARIADPWPDSGESESEGPIT